MIDRLPPAAVCVALLLATAVARGAPPAPGAVTVEATGTGQVFVSWAAAAGATGYTVERSRDGAAGWTAVGPAKAGQTSLTDTGLTAGAAYFYRVRAADAAGTSPPSPTAGAVTWARAVLVGDSGQLRQAAATAVPGTRILLRPGVYAGNIFLADLRIQGTDGRPVVIAAADPAQRPVIRGGGEALKFTDVAYLELHGLVVEGQSTNGINIDDGNSFETPSHHVTLRGVTVRNVGSTGIQSCVRLTGVIDCLIDNCSFAAWGTGGGCGVILVGCHNVTVRLSHFQHTDRAGAASRPRAAAPTSPSGTTGFSTPPPGPSRSAGRRRRPPSSAPSRPRATRRRTCR